MMRLFVSVQERTPTSTHSNGREKELVMPRKLLARPWTPAEEKQLRELVEAGLKKSAIARKLRRPLGSVHSRKSKYRTARG